MMLTAGLVALVAAPLAYAQGGAFLVGKSSNDHPVLKTGTVQMRLSADPISPNR